MPILDGYRATHLIRHHTPYSDLPGIRTTPIVAMTASAIQGDKEKCERAGMDDYLAKPVKSAILEKMLVKWTLKARYHAGSNKSFHSQHTDHDSNCTDFDRSPSILPVRPSAKPSLDSDDSLLTRAMAIDSRLSAAQSEGDRSLRRAAAQEKAEELRNDKLMMAADEENKLQYQLSPGAEPEPQGMFLSALTEENMGKLGREQAASDLITQDSVTAIAAGTGSQGGGNGSHDNESTSTVGSLHGPTAGGGRERHFSRRIPINRNNSDVSQRTVTQDGR